MPDKSPEDLRRIEAELHARFTAARERYHQAKIEANILTDVQAQLGLGHSDGRSAALKAARIEREAIDEYFAALVAFGDFILRKFPLDRTTQK